MKNQSLLEKLFLIGGAIIFIVGLTSLIDFTSISQLTILIGLILTQIGTALISKRTEDTYQRTSLSLLIISWFLAIITLYFGAHEFNISNGAGYMIPLIIGVYSISLLKEKYNIVFNIITMLWSYSFYTFANSKHESLGLIGLTIGLLYLIYNIIIFLRNNKEYPFISFVSTGMILLFTYSIFRQITNSWFIHSSMPLLLTSIFSLFAYKNTIVKNYKHYCTFFKAFLIISTININSCYYWNNFFTKNTNEVLLSIISFIIIQSFLIKRTLDGDNLSFALVFTHFIVFSFTTVSKFVETSILLIFLGASLLTIGYILEKGRQKSLGGEFINHD